MAKTDIKKGDVIKMKSGSCNMTVSKVTTESRMPSSNAVTLSDNIISVDYFWEGKVEKAMFYESQIIKI